MSRFAGKKVHIYVIMMLAILCIGFVGCSRIIGINRANAENSQADSEDADLIVVGFSQPGAESEWRVALTESVKDAFTEEAGYKLIYKDGQSKQDNQIKDIRTFIQQGVDYIILSPIVETGWDQVFQEAKEAGIPIIICDRNVTVSNESLYKAFAGSNFREEGSTAIACVEDLLAQREEQSKLVEENAQLQVMAGTVGTALEEEPGNTGVVEDTKTEEETGTETDETETVNEKNDTTGEKDYFNIVHIQGTIGSSAQVGRSKALEEAVAAHDDWRIIAQECGDFTKGKAREEMTNILQEIDGRDIDMVYCENDEEAYGAMAALNEAGFSYGVGGKIIIVSFDASKNALSMCMSGLINVEVECNPLQGKYLRNIVDQLERGMNVPKIAYIDESYFTPDMLTQEFIDSRAY